MRVQRNAYQNVWLASKKKSSKGKVCSPAYACFTIVMCYVLLLLSSCSGLLSSVDSQNPQGLTPTPAKPSPTSTHSTKADSAPESPLKVELAKVQQIMANMTLDQKLGQLIIVEYLGNDYSASGLKYMISQQYVGGFLYQQSNHNFDAPYDQISNVATLSQQAMQDAKIPLLIGTDQEGGLVNRLYVFHGYLPSAAQIAASGNPQIAYNQGSLAAKWMQQLGINTDLAPVVDVHTVDPPVLESRMYGSDPLTVASYAGAYLHGLQQNNIVGCLKHS